MVDVVSKKCGCDGCPRLPSYSVVESGKMGIYAQHARAGMINVVSKKFCGHDSCWRQPSYGVARSEKSGSAFLPVLMVG